MGDNREKRESSPTAALAAAVFSPITVNTRRDPFAILRGDNDDGGATPTVATSKNGFGSRLILPLTPHPNSFLTPEWGDNPDTPSSTFVEFGDAGNEDTQKLSAAERAESVYRSYALSTTCSPEPDSSPKEQKSPEDPKESAPEARKASPEHTKPRASSSSRSRRQERKDRGESPEPTSAVSVSSSSKGRSQSANCRPTGSIKASLREILLDSRLNDAEKDRDMANIKVNRFLNQMSQQEPGSAQKELLMENRSLYERISTLQRIERELLAENQDLMRQYAALRKHHDARRRQWRDEHHMRDKAFTARIHQLKDQIAQQEEQMQRMQQTHTHRAAPLLSDRDIVAWFTAKDASWHAWAQENAYRDPRRLSSKLHPLQLSELCRGVESFVKLTEDGDLPEEVLAGGNEMIPTLLHGMLVNFICSEAFASPFWIFSAMTAGALESPSIPEPTSNSPVGFRMDLALWNNITPKRLATFAATPGAPLFPPPLATSMVPPLGINTSTPVGLPLRLEMENLHHMLAKAQLADADVTVHHWRAQTMRLFAESGLAVKFPNDPAVRNNESSRLLVETRQNYARKLKERFLGGAARFLLKDQDAAGIERLERKFTEEIDSALRFGCKLWSRPTPLSLKGFTELGGKEFSSTSHEMELCHAQAPPQSEQAILNPETPPPGYFDGRKVLMVVQPALEALGVDFDGEDGEDLSPKLWLKARVVVSVSDPPTNTRPAEPSTPAPDYEKIEGSTMKLRIVPANHGAGKAGEAGPLPPKGFALRIIPSENTPPPSADKAKDEKPTKAMEVLPPASFNPSPFAGDLPKFAITTATPAGATSQGNKVSFSS